MSETKYPCSGMIDATGKVLEFVDQGARDMITARSSEDHPLDSLYISAAETNPAAIFGGTWEYLENVHLFQGWYVYRRIA